MRKTKVICTIGPASEDEATLTRMIKAGMNVARLNMSHGDHEEHRGRIETLKRLRKQMGIPLSIMLDTKGPEVRTGVYSCGSIKLKTGDSFTLTTRDIPGDETIVSVTYENLPNELAPGRRVLIDDGLVELSVQQIEGTEIHTRVVNGGTLSGRKGINLPGTKLGLPALTEKDIDDILFGIEMGIDTIAASFVRRAEDIMEIRKVLNEHGGDGILIFAKIENDTGVANMDDIIKVADGVMVARGDLGVEIPLEQLHAVQKELIHKCNMAGKTVITATQMLDSMIRHPRPTRAEVNDVANSVLDGTDAIMLSGETAAGSYPVEAVSTMCRIALYTEQTNPLQNMAPPELLDGRYSITNAVSHACYTIATDLDATAIITPTDLGNTARRVSRYRPKCPLIATTSREMVYNQLATVWGVKPLMAPHASNGTEMIDNSIQIATQAGLLKDGDVVVISAGVPVGMSGTTNLIQVHVVGDVLMHGKGLGTQKVFGSVCVVNNPQDALSRFHDGDILVAHQTCNELMPLMRRAAGIVVEEDDYLGHAAVVGLALEKTVIFAAPDACHTLRDGMAVTLDPTSGYVYNGEAKSL